MRTSLMIAIVCCAVVASDLPALRELLGEDDAVFAPAGDPAALAAAIRSLADEPEQARRLGERLFEKSRDYTWQARGARLAAVLKQVVG